MEGTRRRSECSIGLGTERLICPYRRRSLVSLTGNSRDIHLDTWDNTDRSCTCEYKANTFLTKAWLPTNRFPERHPESEEHCGVKIPSPRPLAQSPTHEVGPKS